MVMDEAEANHALLGNPLWTDGVAADDAAGAAVLGGRRARARTRAREFKTLGAVLGYSHDSSPVIAGEEWRNFTPAPAQVDTRCRYCPTASAFPTHPRGRVYLR